MWNKLTLRVRITIFTIFMLSLIAIGLTWISLANVAQIFFRPLDLESLENIVDLDLIYEGFADLAREGYIPIFRIAPEFAGEGAIIGTELAAELQQLSDESRIVFRNISFGVVAVFIIIGAMGAFIISGQTLKPIKALAEKIEEIDANNLTTKIELPEAQDEISRLANSFNNMLGKLSLAFESQKLFAQNAAHELKTPLTTIKAGIEVFRLDDKPRTEDYEEILDIVQDSTERLIDIVEGLLSINNIIEKTTWQTFNLKEMFKIIINELSEDIMQKGATITILGDCELHGDKTLLERAFFNLVHNAVRYNIDNGTVKITLSENSIIIEDSGVGIPVEYLPRVFEPFYCVDKSRSKKLGGHGLGMAIAKNIFDRHNIKISITSEQGQGTKILLRFYFL